MMSEVIKIVAPLANVNDSSVVVCEYLADNGSAVTEGQPVIAIETSKATSELTAPSDGIIRFIVGVGEEVPNGTVLALVGDNDAEIDDCLNRADDHIKNIQKPIKHCNSSYNNSGSDIPFGVFESAVTLGEIMVCDGDKTDEGSIIARVRGVTGVEDIKAPTCGYVYWNIRPYETLMAGEPVGIISDSSYRKTVGSAIRVPYMAYHDSKKEYSTLRVSAPAQVLLDKYNVSAKELGLTGLVRAQDVEKILNRDRNIGIIETETSVTHKELADNKKSASVRQAPGNTEELSISKRSEAIFLSEANREAVVSRVSILVPTNGIFSACSEDSELAGRFSAVIIMETAALLKKYRSLQSVYEEGSIYVYDETNIGYALSIDNGLKVPVFRKCNELSLDEIIERKEEYIEKYLEGTLTVDDLSGSTFTITDMSQSGCFMFDPVLNLGQSAILGIGGENPGHTEYPIIMAFDHRVCDGMTAASFLNELRIRLIAHEKTLLPEPDPTDDALTGEPCCEYCFRDVGELREKGHYLFKSIDEKGREKYICSICALGY